MKIERIPISEINPAPYNPRVDLKPGDADYEKLKTSMETFGYIEPLVWNERTKTLVSGHQRLKILIDQGEEEIEASVVNLPLEQERVLNLALNRISGDWDKEKLAVFLDELSSLPDFDVGITGFDTPEISQILDRYGEQKDADDFDFDSALESAGEPVTCRGDVIQLGAHRLMCGDATSKEDVKILLGDERVDLFDKSQIILQFT